MLPDGGVGDIVAAGDKVSFCLLDVERYNTSGPGSPHYLNCGQIQGISVGWADVYDRGLEGQSIEITNVPNGNYWLEVVVDPDNHIIESNENNNVTRIQIALQHRQAVAGSRRMRSSPTTASIRPASSRRRKITRTQSFDSRFDKC